MKPNRYDIKNIISLFVPTLKRKQQYLMAKNTQSKYFPIKSTEYDCLNKIPINIMATD